MQAIGIKEDQVKDRMVRLCYHTLSLQYTFHAPVYDKELNQK